MAVEMWGPIMSLDRFDRVTKSRPCALMGCTSWCLIAKDLSVGVCMRASGASGLNGGDIRPITLSDGSVGYLYRISDSPRPIPPRQPKPTPVTTDFSRWFAEKAITTRPVDVVAYAKSLGVSHHSLSRLGMVMDGDVACFPMYSSDGTIIGGRKRARNGKKWAIENSSNLGVFMPDGGFVPEQVSRAYVCEGPTDLAALLDLDLWGIGRASCSTGSETICKLLTGIPVTVLADRDLPKPRPDGSVRYPGQEGAKKLAEQLCLVCPSVHVVFPPGQGMDVRKWVASGATRAVIENFAAQSREWVTK